MITGSAIRAAERLLLMEALEAICAWLPQAEVSYKAFRALRAITGHEVSFNLLPGDSARQKHADAWKTWLQANREVVRSRLRK